MGLEDLEDLAGPVQVLEVRPVSPVGRLVREEDPVAALVAQNMAAAAAEAQQSQVAVALVDPAAGPGMSRWAARPPGAPTWSI